MGNYSWSITDLHYSNKCAEDRTFCLYQTVSQQCTAGYKTYGACLYFHPPQMLLYCEEGNARARGGGGGVGAKIAEERECMRVIVDRLRAVSLFLHLVNANQIKLKLY